MLRHIVLFRFKTTTTNEQRTELKSMLEALPAQIDVIREFQVGYDVTQAQRSYDMALVSTYNDEPALAIYATHPAHLPVVKRAAELCDSVVSADYLY